MYNPFSSRLLLAAFCLLICIRAGAKSSYLDAFIARAKQQYMIVEFDGLWKEDRLTAPLIANGTMFDVDVLTLETIVEYRPMLITLHVGGYELELARYDIITPDFSVNEATAEGSMPFVYNPGVYYRGVVKGVPGSLAAFSFFSGDVYGLFSLPGGGNMVVEQVKKGVTAGKYILYNDRDQQLSASVGCGTDKLPALQKPATQNKNAFSSCKDVEFYIKADYETWLDYSSNTTNVVNYLTAAFNTVATLYRNEAVYISLKHIEVNTTADIYQTLTLSSSTFLTTFGDETQNNLFGADLAMLVSTRGGNMGGVAWLGTICFPYNSFQSSGPYAFCNLKQDAQALPAYSFDIQQMAHEPGHNLGVMHTHNCGWPGGAIDACVPVEGSCAAPSPQYPPGGGTIMSYCHTVSGVGVDLTKGFGPLPGDTLRDGVAAAACADYIVNTPVIAANANVVATRECVDGDGVTHYLNDGNNDDEADDRLLLKIEKNGSLIGTVDDAGFEVKVVTFPNLGSGNGTNLLLPPGMNNVKTFHAAINRYWEVTPITQPPSMVEVVFPFTRTDVTDADGSVNGNIPLIAGDMTLYQAKSPLDPNPALGFATAAQNDIIIYNRGVSPSPVQWMLSSVADTFFAHFLTNSLNGGTAFYTYFPVSVDDVKKANFAVFPNPAAEYWNVLSASDAELQLHAADGRTIISKKISAGKVEKIDASKLAPGLYFYRLYTDANVHKGTLIRQ
ncbi:M12 family metallo-peptidase [Polluticoccus soli]|uniref:M12 family metallo-peptidase n=1 Tax=Polluticoccus soli TaxID=3034150 RepID=UPI0023E277C6|nr:M12 family metallo-peptidase [Flavipsychrobacter sp. JY13-12]